MADLLCFLTKVHTHTRMHIYKHSAHLDPIQSLVDNNWPDTLIWAKLQEVRRKGEMVRWNSVLQGRERKDGSWEIDDGGWRGVKGKWWKMDDHVVGQGGDKSREGGEWQDRGEGWRKREWGSDCTVWWLWPYVGQAVIVLCIERVLSGQLLAPLSGWSGRAEHYDRKQGWVTFRKRDRDMGWGTVRERIKRTWVSWGQFSDFVSQIICKVVQWIFKCHFWNSI